MKEITIRNGETWERTCTIVIGDHGEMIECGEWHRSNPDPPPLFNGDRLSAMIAAGNQLTAAFAAVAPAGSKAAQTIQELMPKIAQSIKLYEDEIARWRALPWHRRTIESIKWDLEDLRFIMSNRANQAMLAAALVIGAAEGLIVWLLWSAP